MSISRGSGEAETSSAIAISSSVVLPRADSTATTRLPLAWAATMRAAAWRIFSALATDVPPNFITTVSATAPESRSVKRRRAIALLLLLAAGAAAVTVLTSSEAGDESEPASRASVRDPDRLRARAKPASAPKTDPSARLADKLPLDQRVAQIFLVGFEGTTVDAPVLADIRRIGWGASHPRPTTSRRRSNSPP